MKRLWIVVSTALAVALLAHSHGRAEAATQRIEIIAVPSSFSPGTITVQAGVRVRLVFAHTQGVHSIASRDLGIAETVIAEGKDTVVEFTPEHAGSYELHCAIPCGPDHRNMVLHVIVDP